MGSVNIKGTGSGIILDLDKDISFDELLVDTTLKFRESSSFLGKVSVGLLIRGRILNAEEEEKILQAITDNCKINVTCVIKEDPETDKLFTSYNNHDIAGEINDELSGNVESFPGSIDNNAVVGQTETNYSIDVSCAKIYQGSLRSGQTVTEEHSIIIMGDIKPGASVTSNGSIFVLGALRGTVYAGAGGDENAYVWALEMDPLQIRIANAIAISPDADKGPKLKPRRFHKKNDDRKPEIAYILNGHVVKDIYSPSFMKRSFFK